MCGELGPLSFTERRLLVDVAARAFRGGRRGFDRYQRAALWTGPSVQGPFDVTETAEELADAANYLRWEMVRPTTMAAATT